MRKYLLILLVFFPIIVFAQGNDDVKKKDIVTIIVDYVDENGATHRGDILCNKAVAAELTDIFAELFKARYPIHSIRPVSEFNNDDEMSMSANNTSCYNYRVVKGQNRLSKHSQGIAIDINPLWNPCVHIKTGLVEPANAKAYVKRTPSKSFRGKMINTSDLCYRLFIKHGWKWGGAWKSKKDYQHFEK